MATQTIRGGFARADTTGFKQLAKDMRAAKSPLAKTLRLRLRAAGEIVASDARDRAGVASKTIPGSIKVRVSGVMVAVVAGGNGLPLAGLMELGNKGASEGRIGGSGTFRHPVFGRWLSGVDPQPMHPYLVPALEAHKSEFEAAAVEVLDEIAAEFLTGR